MQTNLPAIDRTKEPVLLPSKARHALFRISELLDKQYAQQYNVLVHNVKSLHGHRQDTPIRDIRNSRRFPDGLETVVDYMGKTPLFEIYKATLEVKTQNKVYEFSFGKRIKDVDIN